MRQPESQEEVRELVLGVLKSASGLTLDEVQAQLRAQGVRPSYRQVSQALEWLQRRKQVFVTGPSYRYRYHAGSGPEAP